MPLSSAARGTAPGLIVTSCRSTSTYGAESRFDQSSSRSIHPGACLSQRPRSPGCGTGRAQHWPTRAQLRGQRLNPRLCRLRQLPPIARIVCYNPVAHGSPEDARDDPVNHTDRAGCTLPSQPFDPCLNIRRPYRRHRPITEHRIGVAAQLPLDVDLSARPARHCPSGRRLTLAMSPPLTARVLHRTSIGQAEFNIGLRHLEIPKVLLLFGDQARDSGHVTQHVIQLRKQGMRPRSAGLTASPG
jgi:hypothetical protein